MRTGRAIQGSPCVLLVEDDPASRLFLATVLEALPATVVVAGSLAEARQCVHGDGFARDGAFDLWLFDANLPDGSAAAAAALRSLFLAELPGQRDAVLAACDRNDAAALIAQLHRLRASCGFAGAARLATAVDGLREAPVSIEARTRFAHAARDVLDSA